MTLLKNILSFFQRPAPTPAEAMPDPPSQAVVITSPEPVSVVEQPTVQPEPLPDWLVDESLLRDEGVLFGLSDSRPEEKIAMIRTYFQRLTAPLEREVEQHNEKVGELNLFIGEKEDRMNDLRQKIAELTTRQPGGEHQLPRTLAGLLFSAAMCVGNYYLIEETLQPAFQHSRWVSVGVFLAGMFSLFNRTSAFHDHSARLTFRRLVEEAGLPLAASLFVFMQAAQTQPVGQAAALFVFIFFLFLLAGKLLLGNLTVLRNDLRYWSEARRIGQEKETKIGEWDRQIQQLTAEVDALRIQKWQVIPVLNRVDAELHRINARRDSLIHLFVSEYNLARSLRSRLTESERRAIRDE